MASPQKPTDMKYDDLCKLLHQYYVLYINPLKERQKFFALTRKSGESAMQWLGRMQTAAIDCDFSTDWEKFVLNKFATHLTGKAFDRTAEEKIADLTLTKAVELAIKYEKLSDAPMEKVDFVASKGSRQKNYSKSRQMFALRFEEPLVRRLQFSFGKMLQVRHNGSHFERVPANKGQHGDREQQQQQHQQQQCERFDCVKWILRTIVRCRHSTWVTATNIRNCEYRRKRASIHLGQWQQCIDDKQSDILCEIFEFSNAAC